MRAHHDGFRIWNYLTASNVLIWSAVTASCAVPFVFGAYDLKCLDENGEVTDWIPFGASRFVDGSLDCDIPLRAVSESFSVNNFIVSQVNPWFSVVI